MKHGSEQAKLKGQWPPGGVSRVGGSRQHCRAGGSLSATASDPPHRSHHPTHTWPPLKHWAWCHHLPHTQTPLPAFPRLLSPGPPHKCHKASVPPFTLCDGAAHSTGQPQKTAYVLRQLWRCKRHPPHAGRSAQRPSQQRTNDCTNHGEAPLPRCLSYGKIPN